MTPRRWLFLFLALLTVLRLLYIGQLELSPDESYYHLWSKHPDWSYYSKGPGVAMAILAGTSLFGDTEFGVRFFSPLLALGTSLILFSLARRLYGESAALWTVIAMNTVPILQVGGLVMTIDPLSIFFWAAALLTFWLALERSPGFSLHWPLTGLLIGAGFLSKYTNALQGLSILLATTAKFRHEFKRHGFWLMVATFLLCTLPVIAWNRNHEWITVVHLRNRGGLDHSGFNFYHVEELLAFAGAHAGVYSPLIFAGMMIALFWGWKKMRTQFKARFLMLFSLPLLLLYAVLSLKRAGQPNWTAPAFLSLGILSVALWLEAARTSRAKARFAVAAMGVGLFMSLLIINTDLPRQCGIPWPYRLDPGSRLRGWKTAACSVDALRKQFEQSTGKPVFLIGNKYQTSASLSFYLPDKRLEGPGHPPVYIAESQMIENQFSFWPRYDEFVSTPPGAHPADAYYTEEQGVNPFAGRNALYIADDEYEAVPTAIQSGFERVEMIAAWRCERRGLPLRNLRVFACFNYRPLPL
jgi:hypothetical protein